MNGILVNSKGSAIKYKPRDLGRAKVTAGTTIGPKFGATIAQGLF